MRLEGENPCDFKGFTILANLLTFYLFIREGRGYREKAAIGATLARSAG
jgi:hypothetical protein